MKRSELYAHVWSKPTSSLARDFGCSDTWIKRICKSHNIPQPPRGYWRRLTTGNPTHKTPLPTGEDVETGLDLSPSFVPTQSSITVAGASPRKKKSRALDLTEIRKASDRWDSNRRVEQFLNYASDLASLQPPEQRAAIGRRIEAIRLQLQSEPPLFAVLLDQSSDPSEL